MKVIQKILFVLRCRYQLNLISFFRKKIYLLQSLHIGRNTHFAKFHVTWPHQVSIGNNCYLERNIFFKFDGIWQQGPSIIIKDHVFIGHGCEFNIRSKIIIGSNSLIASGCKFIDHDHGIEANMLMRLQHGPEKEIIIGSDVWLGCNVIVLKGVQVGDGCIIAAGAVVTKSVEANEIWAGVPAKKIGQRKAP